MSNSVDRLVVLVTAGSAGLGAAVARRSAQIGARVIINYCSNRKRADTLVEELQSQYSKACGDGNAADGVQFVAIQADMNVLADIKTLVEKSVQLMGRLDVVVSNHGWTTFTNFLDLEQDIDVEVWDHCFNMNVKSPLFLFHAAKVHLEAVKGSFITVSSLSAQPAYSVTKAAQNHLVKSLALIAAPNVRVNTVAPSLMLTEWGMKFPATMHDAVREKNPLKKIIALEDVADHIVHLAHNRSITGTVGVVDAGYLLA